MADPQQRRQHRIDPSATPFAFVWEDSGRKLSVLRRTARTDTGFRPGTAVVQATPACLVADGEDAPQVFCASGWRPQDGDHTSGNFLDGARWTALVRRFAALSPGSFRLPRSFRDTPKSPVHVEENSGRYYACHTEKKLGLYFLVQQMKFAGLGLRETLAGGLRSVPLPPNRRGATIVLGHKPCKNCRLFLQFIRQRTGINLRTQPCPIYVEHEGRPVAFRGGKPTERGADAASAAAAAPAMPGDDNEDMERDELAGAADQDDSDAAEDDQAAEDEQATDVDDDDADENMDHDADAEPDALDIAEARLVDAPTGNVARPRQTPPASPDEPPTAPAPEPPRTPQPPVRASTTQQSPLIRDTPEPSISPSLSATPDRRHQFPVYTTPTRRRQRTGNDDDDDASVAPPAVWKGRSKPPVTPSLQPPPWMIGEGSSLGDGGEEGASDTGVANVSYHFATPSEPSREGTSDGQGDQVNAAEDNAAANATEDPPPAPAAVPSVRPASHPHAPFAARGQLDPVPEVSRLPAGWPLHETAPGGPSIPSQPWRRARTSLFRQVALPPPPPPRRAQPPPAAAGGGEATTAAAPPARLRPAWALGTAIPAPRQSVAAQEQTPPQTRPAAEVIDLTDDSPVQPSPPFLPRRPPRQALQPLQSRSAPQRRRGTATRGRTKKRSGAFSGPLSYSSRRRFPSLDSYRYNNQHGHV